MHNRNPPFDHSGSFGDPQASPLQAQALEWQYALQNSQRALLHHTMDSPRLQQFRNNTADTWVPGYRHFAIPTTPSFKKGRSGSGVQSPDSDTTVKQTNGDKGRDLPGSDENQTMSNAISLLKRVAAGLGIDPGAIDEYLADDAVLRAVQPQPQEYHDHQQQQTMYSLPSPWNPTAHAHEEGKTHSRVSSGGTLVTDYTHVDSADSDGCMSNTYRNPHGFRAADTSGLPQDLHTPEQTNLRHRKMGSPQDLHVPEQTCLHHRRMSSRMSSLPTIPSPLGPGRMMRMGSDTSGLVSPAPGSQGPKLEYGDGGQRSQVPTSSTTVQGLNHRRGETDNVGSPALKPPSFGNGVGHSRQDTDPFVDYAEARTAETPKHFSLPQSPSRVPKTPGLPTASAPVTPFSPSFASGPAPQALPSPRPNLPVPRPPLSSINGQYTHTPHARAQLDAHKDARSSWIRSSAAQIAQLSGLRYVAQLRYESTQTLQDYAAWQEAEAAFASATDLETRKEERRNLFLAEKGMVSLKTDVAGDASASATDQAGGEERLLGFKMAYMERVCAEVKREEESEGGITREMLATLTLEERKALRAHLVARLARV
jgi:hypothetical protein